MREDLPDWLGKPPLRGTDQWAAWLDKWRQYAKTVLRDRAADDPDYDYGLLSVEERCRVALRLQVQAQIDAGRQNAPIASSFGRLADPGRRLHARARVEQPTGEPASPAHLARHPLRLHRRPRRRGRGASLVVARLRGRVRGRVGARERDRDRRRPAGIGCGRPARGQSIFT